MSTPNLTIAIPTYNNVSQLCETLWSLTTHVEYPYRLIIVNNGDEKIDGIPLEWYVRRNVTYPEFEIIHAGKNLGWQGGINRAFEYADQTDFFCMMNDDLIFLPFQREFFRKLIRCFRHPDIGAVGPVSNYVMGSQHVSARLPEVHLTTLLIGFCMVVRSKVFSEIGGLNANLVGGDDLDLSILIQDAGYKLMVLRSCYVHHIGSQTGPRVEEDFQWNSLDHVDAVNNQLIQKHGVRKWYNCSSSRTSDFAPLTTEADEEGDCIRDYLKDVGRIGLDLGCGANETVPWAVKVDHRAKGLRSGAGGLKTAPGAITELQHELWDLHTIEDGSQDFLVARHSLEHLDDPVAALKEWRRVLKPDGRLIIACPNEEVLESSILLDYTHKHAYTMSSLMNLLNVCGFSWVEGRYMLPAFTIVVCVEPDLGKIEAERSFWKDLPFAPGMTV